MTTTTGLGPWARSPVRVARVVRPAAAAMLWVLWACCPAAGAQPAVPATSPAAGGQSTAALEEVVRTATTDSPPAEIRLMNRDIVTLRATVALRTPAVRRLGAEGLLADLIAGGTAGLATSRPIAGGEVISVGDQDIFALLPADLDPAGVESLPELAQQTVARLQRALDEAEELGTFRTMVEGVALAALATIALVVLLRLLLRARDVATRGIARAADRHLQRFPGAEVVRVSRLEQFLPPVVGFVSVGLALLLIYAWLTFVMRRFPYTRPWGESLRELLLERLTGIGSAMVDAVPGLLTVALIVLLTRFAIKLAGTVFEAVEQGRASIPWMYPETAQPTRRLVATALWLFALALAYPYLPGAHTDAFKGVSVFAGLVISLGSSGLVNQVMSGLTLTYSRALRVGDFVRIGDTEGTVTHLGALSTKLKTPRREEVTIPNAVVVSEQTTNYSRLAGTDGVFAATTITIGYDTPWRQVKALLLRAAERTHGVRATPPPVVRQTALKDSYAEYALLVCLEDVASRPATLDLLHGHIQDQFNEHGVQIMSPNYEGDPDHPKMVSPERWFASPASPAGDEALSGVSNID